MAVLVVLEAPAAVGAGRGVEQEAAVVPAAALAAAEAAVLASATTFPSVCRFSICSTMRIFQHQLVH